MTDLSFESAVDLVNAIKSRKVRSIELLDHYIERMQRFNPQINAIVATDLKKVLAYSTLSQLGYMVTAMGAGAYTAGLFHLFTHAFFKALLFLGAGAVMHSLHDELDMWKMGNVKKYMPRTHWTFLVATVAIAGIPPLAGFVSKDAILAKAFEAGYTDLNHHGGIYYLLWFLGLAGAALTAFYMFRLVFMTFFGSFRGGEEAEHHVHESPWTMTMPLVVLAGVLLRLAGRGRASALGLALARVMVEEEIFDRAADLRAAKATS